MQEDYTKPTVWFVYFRRGAKLITLVSFFTFPLIGLCYLIKLNTRGTKKWRVSVLARLSEFSFDSAIFENFCVLTCVNFIFRITTKYC
jgi:hypothetical protein